MQSHTAMMIIIVPIGWLGRTWLAKCMELLLFSTPSLVHMLVLVTVRQLKFFGNSSNIMYEDFSSINHSQFQIKLHTAVLAT